MGQTLSPHLNLGYDLNPAPQSDDSFEKSRTKNGAKQIRRQNAKCVTRLENHRFEPDDGDSALKIRRDALLARFRLLESAQTRPIVMSVTEAMQWSDLVVPLGACLYNEHSSCSSHDAMSVIVASVFETVPSMLVNRIQREDLRPGASVHLQKLLCRCFWSGTLLNPTTTLRFMPLVPCDFPDVRNMIAVHCALRRAVPFRHIETTDLAPNKAPLRASSTYLRVRETNGECLLIKDEWDVHNNLPEHYAAAPCREDKETVIISDAHIKPRDAVQGWIARVLVYLIDKYGRDHVPLSYIQDTNVLLQWVALPRTLQEIWFEQVAAHVTGDYNPLLLLSRQKRVEYAKIVLTRRDHESMASSTSPSTKTEETKARDFEWTVTSVYQSEVAEVIHNTTNETKVVVVGDPSVDPTIAESISAFMHEDDEESEEEEEEEEDLPA